MRNMMGSKQRIVAAGLLLGLVGAFLIVAVLELAQPVEAAQAPMAMGDMSGSSMSSPDAVGTTGGWFQGQDVTFLFTQEFFCRMPPSSHAPSMCEIGAPAQIQPVPGQLPTLYSIAPIGFQAPTSTLHCQTVGYCVDHPRTLDISRIGGPNVVLLPVHSHIVDVVTSGWWGIHTIGVKDLDTWNQVVAGKSLATVRALQASDPNQIHITKDNLSNGFLFFQVMQ